MTFEEAWRLTRTISSETAFSQQEARALFEAASTIPDGATVMEVGCEFGRSTSVLAQLAMERNWWLVLVDPFVSNVESKPWLSLIEMLVKTKCLFSLHGMKTQDVSRRVYPGPIKLLHIDGDHSTDGIRTDCAYLLQHVVAGGLACFHDYGRDSLPEVWPVVDQYTEGWDEVALVETLKIVRKPIDR